MAPGWTAACVALRSGRVRDQETGEFVATAAEAAHSSSRPPTQENFFSVEWRAAQAEPDSNVPSEAALLMALIRAPLRGRTARLSSGRCTWRTNR